MTPETDTDPTKEYGATSSSENTEKQVHQFFLPFNRISGSWDSYEIIKTVIMGVFVFPIRLLYLALAGLIMLTVASIATIGVTPSHAQDNPIRESKDSEILVDGKDPLFTPPSPWRRFLILLLFPIARSILFVSFGVYHIKSDKAEPSCMASREKMPVRDAYVIIGNHLGYIDILVLLCRYRSSFVSKGELEHAPLVGSIARALQCMFVRKGQSLTTQLINRIQATYECHRKRQNCPGCAACMSKLVIFPEGTTANGKAMVPFRTGVFNAGLPVVPVCIRFPWRRFNLSWETIRFREHMFRTMTQFVNYVHCTELPVFVPSAEEVSNARLYALNVQNAMNEVLNQPIVPLNRKHKFLYHSYLLGKETNVQEVLKKAYDLQEQDDQLTFFIENTKGDDRV